MKLVKLSEVCLFNPPKNEARLALDSDQLVSFMPMQDLGIESIIAEARSSRTLGEVIKAYTYFAENDVLIAKITPCFENGKMGIARNLVNGVGFGSSEYFVLRPMDSILSEYLYYFLRQKFVIENGREVMTGAVGHRRIPGEYLENLEIPLPSLEMQRKIVEKLDIGLAEVDSQERNLELIRESCNLLLQSIMHHEYQLAGKETENLDSLVDILDSQRIPINSTERMTRPGDVPYYGATGQVGTIDKAIFDDTLILLGEDGVPFFDSSKHKAYEISGPAWVNNHAHVLKAKEDRVVQRYLLHYLNIFNYSGYVNGATRLKLTQGDMKRIPVPLPEMKIQMQIAQKIDSAIGEIQSLRELDNTKRELLAALRQSLLSSEFTQYSRVA